ncbi:protein of unknown function DUF323 [Planctopirus limnophila DSM 3776]|uniref:Sulfatase-modifying factor enzyme-like domain-containing protein n=1 Tax=Planctopirus limnophila (strain ATCC 43296 / DSM 3776 / IFAM 1008 / Mu 290) TaxID=521674 RepID=D5ST79_PLAL2|nr:formylglycine-generating enzyme family protein [Planctopirus limnophila]ADG66847.1 protein of unknown function DUF323 [Planctopirus limnophila DSM 3776]
MSERQFYLWNSVILANLIFSVVLVAPVDAQTLTTPSSLESPFTADGAKAGQEAWAKHLGKSVVEKNTIGMDLVLIPPGKFRLGSPPGENGRDTDEKQVDVTLTQPFRLGRTEVTLGQWRQVMGTIPWNRENFIKKGPDYPATFVSWEDARAFCEKLSQIEGKTYLLPTEAQWEWSCRGGTTTRFSIPNEKYLTEYAWFNDNAADEKYAHRVGLKRPNPFGLSDIHGNAWEWCQDWYGERYSIISSIDPCGPSSGSDRVIRGGSWDSITRGIRSAERGGGSPDAGSYLVGFRVSRIELP